MKNTENFDPDEYARICSYERRRIRLLPLNDQYTQQFEYDGRIFYYDPDYDCFYPITPWEELSYWDRWGWLWATAILTGLAFLVSK